ncbi:hypothetical protein [Actinomycetospora termitidis]|uniref:Polysaccharide biosynthesis protein n=1 Tax=Actinomycetospora termitidis TaxID=3053470 RepID=A0ABT7MHG9_9PSEU|nr:hypothetical protein [Actinomycetospora sp. Odt1-22]MDL5160131.1 hypothetical protein [Actinomycetospora sp. Odt1-22]
MSLSAAGASLVGMVSWVLAARVLTPTQLGTAAAFVSATLLVAGCTDLNLGIGLMRWLPRAGGAARVLVLRGAGTVAGLAGLVALVYVLLPHSSLVVDAAAGPDGDRAVAAGLFVLTAMLYAVFQQQDFVLVGLGRPWWAPSRIGLFAVARLAVLLGLGATLTTVGVVWSWLLPTAGAVVLAAVVVAQTLSRSPGNTEPWVPHRRDVVAFLGPTYSGKIATAVLYNQVPLVVTFRFGPEVGASFFLVWQAITVIDVVALYFVAPLSSGIARAPERADELARATRRRLLLLLLPPIALGAAISGPLLGLFGGPYRAAAPVLALMLLGCAARLLVIHRLGEHQARGRAVRYARLAVVNTVFVLGVALLAPPASTSVPGLLLPVAAGFVVVQVLCAGAVLLRRRYETPIAPAASGS